jgi:glc operon protein GlcG
MASGNRDPGSTGSLVMLQKLDNTQTGSVEIAVGKARTALEGGVPVIVNGKVVGAVGVSGVTSEQDAQIAMAGAAVAK